MFHFEIKTDHNDAIYKCGEAAKFEISLLDSNGKNVSGVNFTCNITGDWGLSKEFKLTSTTEGSCVVKATLDKPGFILCKANYKPENTEKLYEGSAGVGFDPLLIKSQRPEPIDFDAFWENARKELASVPMKAKMTPIDIPEDQLECFDVKIDCAGDVPVSGYLVKPENAKPGSLPAYISYHGAGVSSARKNTAEAKLGLLAMDINAHGIENGKPDSFYNELEKGSLDGYRTRNCDDPLKIYHRAMFLRVLRSLEFLKSQPEWDGRRLIVSGTSQGGAQALIAAALDPQVSFCIANVPAFCLNAGILDGQAGFHWFIKTKDRQLVNQAIIDTVPYYDATSFAKRIKCPCVLSTGFIDPYCPPTSVYSAFNNIPVKNKRIINNIHCGHDVPKETSAECEKAYKEHIKQ